MTTSISTNHFCMDLALRTGALSCWNLKGPSPNCCHKVGNTESSRMPLYAVASRFPFTETKGPSPNHEKQPQTIIPPPPNVTVGTMHFRQVASLQRMHFHCSKIQYRQALHHSRWRLALHMVILDFYAAAGPWKPISWNSQRTVLVLACWRCF